MALDIDAKRLLESPKSLIASHDQDRGGGTVDAGHRVRFFRADALIELLYRGLADNSVGRVIDSILRAELVVVDELSQR